jgi:hypothetical protein
MNKYICTRWFKYDRDKLWLVYTQVVPVIFETRCVCVYICGATAQRVNWPPHSCGLYVTHNDILQLVGLLCTRIRHVADNSTSQRIAPHPQKSLTSTHPSKRAAAHQRLLSHWERPCSIFRQRNVRSSYVHLYCKGRPEKCADLCPKWGQTSCHLNCVK